MKNTERFLSKHCIPDIAGTCISMLCMVHCVFAPLLLTPWLLQSLIPVTHLDTIRHDHLHATMLVCTLIVGTTSLYLSARRGKHMAVLCLALGLVAVSAAELFMHDLIAVRMPGTLCIIGGHLWAMRASGKPCYSPH